LITAGGKGLKESDACGLNETNKKKEKKKIRTAHISSLLYGKTNVHER